MSRIAATMSVDLLMILLIGRTGSLYGRFEMNRGGGIGIIGVVIIVLVILWLVGVIKL